MCIRDSVRSGKASSSPGKSFSSSSSSSSPHPHIYERGPGTYSVASCYNDDRLCSGGGGDRDSSMGSSDEWVDIETDAENEGCESSGGGGPPILPPPLERNVSFAR